MLGSTWTIGRLLFDVLRGAHGPRTGVRETVVGWRDAHPEILYEPSGSAGSSLVLVHGVTARATRDPMLVHLARCLASLGYRCLTPPLPRLASFAHDPQDVTGLGEALARAADMAKTTVGVMAFSYGSSYALRAAGAEPGRGCCQALVAFGAYYRLADALEHQRQWLVRVPRPTPDDDADLTYLRYTLLACDRASVDLSAVAWRDIDAALLDFTAPGPIGPKRDVLLQHGRHIDYAELMARYQSRDLAKELSPAGSLLQVTCPVGLLHDPGDRFVPPEQALRIAQELDARPGYPKTAILTTPLFSHVRITPARKLLDWPRLVRLLRPVLDLG